MVTSRSTTLVIVRDPRPGLALVVVIVRLPVGKIVIALDLTFLLLMGLAPGADSGV
ncbi:unnamed protein product [Prunus armeniaca]|uniref:Uncharacterized protein n=1 Tax=Prunus armeniaca TaxID=36596 RepID=A0A6J5X3V6_PRUAR|nr:unnamed protein product [Prunus armeniaca]CAB4282862.1 unnamed protein product [Prunus armeniaca]CAB4306642.1 unnamed protein product [Prunus armeniaca]